MGRSGLRCAVLAAVWLVTRLRPAACSGLGPTPDPSVHFYIYDLPDIYHRALLNLTIPKWRPDYSAEVELHEWLAVHPWRVWDPCEADLFFMPVYMAQMIQAWPPPSAS